MVLVEEEVGQNPRASIDFILLFPGTHAEGGYLETPRPACSNGPHVDQEDRTATGSGCHYKLFPRARSACIIKQDQHVCNPH